LNSVGNFDFDFGSFLILTDTEFDPYTKKAGSPHLHFKSLPPELLGIFVPRSDPECLAPVNNFRRV